MPVLFLTEADVRGLLTMELALDAVGTAFRKVALDEATNVPRQRCQTDAVMLHVLPAAAKTFNAVGLKAYTTGRFPAVFHVYLYDGRTGALSAILEADHLGAFRTGAASGVATDKLARPDAATVGLFGAGKQARTQLEAMCKVRRISGATVYSRDAAKRTAFAEEMSKACNVPVTPTDSPEAAAENDIVVTATSAREPVLKGEWLADGTHVNLVGANMLHKSEADAEVFRKAGLVAIDSKDQGRAEAGGLVASVGGGVLTWADVKELGQILVGRVPGRESATAITVFHSLGVGIEDVTVAAKVVELARQRGVGTTLPI